MSGVQEQVNSAVESAKEAAAKVGEGLSDLIHGNPFSSPVGKKIEQATDANCLATENWGLNMEICDFINNTEEGGRDAIRAIRKRLHTQMSKNNAIVMYTLTVLETCVKNGDHRFHVLVCQKEFILDLVKLIGPKFDAPQVIQERVLSLIQAWSDCFRNQPDLVGVRQVFDDLRQKGVEFPATDLDSLAPIITPKRSVYTESPVAAPVPAADASSSQHNYQVMPTGDLSGPVEASPEQLAKLRKDMDVVNSNLKVLREMLTEIVPGKETADELQLLEELYTACQQMRQRVLDLIRVVANEECTYELLVVNDEFNSVFEKYDRFVANRNAPPGAAEAAAAAAAAAAAQPPTDQLIDLNINGSSDSYAAGSEAQAAVGLATAAHDKTVPITEREAKEMEGWLEQQGGEQNTAPSAAAAPISDSEAAAVAAWLEEPKEKK